MTGAATPLRLDSAVDEPVFHQSSQSLPHGSRRNSNLSNEFGDSHRARLTQQLDHLAVQVTGLFQRSAGFCVLGAIRIGMSIHV